MAVNELVAVITQLSLGAITTFLAILLWSNTRDTGWMLVIMGTILRYGGIMYSTLKIFGVVPADVYLIPEVLEADVILNNLPDLFFAAAFIVLLARRARRI